MRIASATSIRRGALWAAVAAMLAAAPAGAQQSGLGAGGCPWTEFTRLPGLSTYPDHNTQVFQCVYSASPVHETVIEGRPPRARFWSFAVIDQARREIDSITDDEVQLRPDGSYEIRVAGDCGNAPNCLDLAGTPAPLAPERIYYRVYVPEGGDTGGVQLPRVTYRTGVGEPERTQLLDDGALAALELAFTAPLLPGAAVADVLAQPSGLEQPVPPGATGPDPPADRFRGLGAKQVDSLAAAGVPAPVVDALRQAVGSGGFGATRDNAYVTVAYSMREGNLEVRALAPTYRAQSPTPANDRGRSDGSEQVRYWSLCTTQATRPVDCVRDERVPLDANGFFTAVVAPSCPVAGYEVCLRSGVLSAAGPPLATLLYRNTLPADGFFNELGPAECPSPDTMFCGDHALQARYVARP